MDKDLIKKIVDESFNKGAEVAAESLRKALIEACAMTSTNTLYPDEITAIIDGIIKKSL
jgi:hypothetical protein